MFRVFFSPILREPAHVLSNPQRPPENRIKAAVIPCVLRPNFQPAPLKKMINGENGGVAKPTPPPTLPKSYTPSAAAAYRLASMERLAQRQRIFEQGGPPPPPPGADDHLQHQSPAPVGGTPPPPPVTAPKPVLGTKASHPFFLYFVIIRVRGGQTGNGRRVRRYVLAVFVCARFITGAPGQYINYCTIR